MLELKVMVNGHIVMPTRATKENTSKSMELVRFVQNIRNLMEMEKDAGLLNVVIDKRLYPVETVKIVPIIKDHKMKERHVLLTYALLHRKLCLMVHAKPAQ